MRLGRLTTGLALAAALLAGLVAPATAHKERYESKVTIRHPELGIWQGKVKSKKPSCIRGRLVELWVDDEVEDFVLAKDTTDSEGRWRVKPAPGSTYYATVTRAKKTPGDHKHVCKGDRSPTIE